MKSNLIATLTIFLTILSSCKNNQKISDLRIEKNKDTVLTTETVDVKIHLDNYKKTCLPAFFIIGSDDTLRIPFDNEIKCGLFKGMFHKIGKKECHGFVEYYDKTGKFKKEDFAFSFIVKKSRNDKFVDK